MSLQSGDLTTLADVKAYITSAPADAVISGLITRLSRSILTYLNRPFIVPHDYREQFNGGGTRQLVLPNWPVLSISSLYISGVGVSEAVPNTGQQPAPLGSGWRFQPWNGFPPGDPAVVELVGGFGYNYGNQNVVVSYRAGYRVTGEQPNATPYTPLAPYGIWATDEGVTYKATGAALTPVANSPGVGQYVAPTPNATSPVNTYTFNSADISTGILISYGFVPADLEQACIEWIAERSSYRGRVGLRSQSLAAQESMSFDTSGIPAYLQAMLAPYMSVVPPNIGASV